MKTWREEETAFYQELAERLRITRKTLGISEHEAADAAGVTVATYRKWEKGGHIRGTITLRSFCDELGVSFHWLTDDWGHFLDEPYDEFEDYRESQARVWRERMAFIRRRSAGGNQPTAAGPGGPDQPTFSKPMPVRPAAPDPMPNYLRQLRAMGVGVGPSQALQLPNQQFIPAGTGPGWANFMQNARPSANIEDYRRTRGKPFIVQ